MRKYDRIIFPKSIDGIIGLIHKNDSLGSYYAAYFNNEMIDYVDDTESDKEIERIVKMSLKKPLLFDEDTNIKDLIKVGNKCYWLDPEIKEYPKKERQDILKREFVIQMINGESNEEYKNEDDIILISDDFTETEVYANELVFVNQQKFICVIKK